MFEFSDSCDFGNSVVWLPKTRAGLLQAPGFRLSRSRRAFSYLAASSWNRLPPAVTGSRTRAEFMRLLEVLVAYWT